mgnify:CR=1 FL=1
MGYNKKLFYNGGLSWNLCKKTVLLEKGIVKLFDKTEDVTNEYLSINNILSHFNKDIEESEKPKLKSGNITQKVNDNLLNIELSILSKYSRFRRIKIQMWRCSLFSPQKTTSECGVAKFHFLAN